MGTPTGRFGRTDRLLRASEFLEATREGSRVVGRSFVLAARVDPTGGGAPAPRLGITVSRRVGGAVVRNHLKRCVREWFRRARSELPPGLQLVVIARRGAGGLSCPEVGELLDDASDRLGARLS